MKKLAMIAFAGAILASCTSVEKLQQQNFDNSFSGRLATNYADLAQYEAKEYDWADSNHYAKKAKKAAAGKNVAAEEISNWKIQDKFLPELKRAKKGLSAISSKHNMTHHAQTLANAQTSFDCWIEEREENWQYSRIKQCKHEFYEAHNKLAKNPLTPEVFIEGDRHSIYFKTSSAAVCGCSSKPSGKIAAYLNTRTDVKAIEIHGYADSTGSAKFNKKISIARAEAVKSFLVSKGFDAENIKVVAHGDNDLAVKTAKGVKNNLNRRVEVVFIK